MIDRRYDLRDCPFDIDNYLNAITSGLISACGTGPVTPSQAGVCATAQARPQVAFQLVERDGLMSV